MSSAVRQVRVRAYAKINLSLLVLGKRADGYHELRTIFQTVSLHDTLDIAFAPSRSSAVQVRCGVEIDHNIAGRAAEMVMEAARARGRVSIAIAKRIPMGGGLGGGSSDAAAVLLALPALCGRALAVDRLIEIAAQLGSDVPFFLHGGTALGVGRGEEIYPLPSLRAAHVIAICPRIAVRTAEAYEALARPSVTELTSGDLSNRMKKFQSLAAGVVCPEAHGGWTAFCDNDFEAVVFRRYPLLQSFQRQLVRLGAAPARMSGSGSTLFGVFPSREQKERAIAAISRNSNFKDVQALEKMRFISREQYRAQWRRWLTPDSSEAKQWPPRQR
jgi:4-diphosphocytidyl-2-C-methyl-D-erythritol kinase